MSEPVRAERDRDEAIRTPDVWRGAPPKVGWSHSGRLAAMQLQRLASDVGYYLHRGCATGDHQGSDVSVPDGDARLDERPVEVDAARLLLLLGR